MHEGQINGIIQLHKRQKLAITDKHQPNMETTYLFVYNAYINMYVFHLAIDRIFLNQCIYHRLNKLIM